MIFIALSPVETDTGRDDALGLANVCSDAMGLAVGCAAAEMTRFGCANNMQKSGTCM
jgi:hypothetical protein